MIEIQQSPESQLRKIPHAKDLQFGRYFTDHWFFSNYTDELGWYESKIAPYGHFQLDPAASVLHYGQSLFEGMKAFRQVDGSISLFRPEFNYERMSEGAARLCMVPPPKDLFMRALKNLIMLESKWVPTEENCSLYIRPTLIGTEGFLGVRPSRKMMFFIILSPVGSYYAGGLAPTKIWVEDKAVRAAVGGLGATKAGANYAASLQAALNAKKHGYDQVLWLDVNHEGIEEVGTMNVFWVFKNEIVTPVLNGSILAGGMRDSVLQLLTIEGRPVHERRITMSEVIERQKSGDLLEAFGTGTAAVISPIGELAFRGESFQINQNKIGALSQHLYSTISGIQRGLELDRFGWMRPLSDLA